MGHPSSDKWDDGDDKINIEIQFVISSLSTWRGRPCLVVGAVHRTFQCPQNYIVFDQRYNLLSAPKVLLDCLRAITAVSSAHEVLRICIVK